MKTFKFLFVAIAIVFASLLHAKSPAHGKIDSRYRAPIQQKNLTDMPMPVKKGSATFPADPLSALVAAPGADYIGIRSHYYLQTNGRGLHNIQVDPDAPNQIHAVIMATSSNSDNDSVGGAFESRRVYYTYSSDGGATWSTKKSVGGNTRLGYPQLVLYKRDNVNIPIIIAHKGPDPETDQFVIQLYIEQGAPGEGNFAMTPADRMASDGNEYNIIFPTVALSNDQTMLHVIAAPTFNTANTYGYLEYGNFTLNADRTAKWNGWKNHPGGETVDGYAAGGIQVLRVAPNGTIGALWLQPEEDNKKLFFSESTDNGATWTQNLKPLYVPDGPNASLNDALLACNDGLDFFYDGANKAHFLWEADYQVFADNTFYPYTSAIFSWAMGDPKVNVISAFYDFEFTDLAIFDSLYLPIEKLHTIDYFTPENHSSANGYTPTGIPLLSNPTYAVNAADPNNWKIYYTTYVDGDEQSVGDFDGTGEKFYYFRSTYEQTTYDNGASWTEPKPFRSNQNVAEEEKLDYAYPQASFYNEPSGSGAKYHVLFAADTMPGQLFNYGTPGWSFVSWYHQMQSTNAVTSPVTYAENISLGQNYPNPAASSITTIPFTLSYDGNVVLTVSDILGRSVMNVSYGRMAAGDHSVALDLSSLPNGTYQYSVRLGSEAVSRLMTVIRN
jgi:3D (Asp-Asp-Asp) domain-containing protein